MSHVNEEHCSACLSIMNRYPGLNETLRIWVLALRIENLDLHVSSAGRGRVEQEVFFQRGASRAHYGESSHNYNCALDLFQLKDGEYSLDKDWFEKVVGVNIYPALRWYGAPGAEYFELPHIENNNWRSLAESGQAKLVE